MITARQIFKIMRLAGENSIEIASVGKGVEFRKINIQDLY
jgi:hypothetical protein